MNAIYTKLHLFNLLLYTVNLLVYRRLNRNWYLLKLRSFWSYFWWMVHIKLAYFFNLIIWLIRIRYIVDIWIWKTISLYIILPDMNSHDQVFIEYYQPILASHVLFTKNIKICYSEKMCGLYFSDVFNRYRYILAYINKKK